MPGWLFAALCFTAPLLASVTSDDERIARLEEQIQTMESMVNAAKSQTEKTRLETKMERLALELNILKERQAIELRERDLVEARKASPLDTLRERLRSLDFTVEDREARMKEIMDRRQKTVMERDQLKAQLASDAEKSAVSADKRSELEEKMFTRNEELRALALEQEATEFEADVAREAQRLREWIKSIQHAKSPALRLLLDGYTRLNDGRDAQARLALQAETIEQSLRVYNGSLELARLKLSKFDEELVLLEKQSGFWGADPKVARLMSVQRGQKQAILERIPFLSGQVTALTRAQSALHLRGEMLKLEAMHRHADFESMKQAYLLRLRWPAMALGALAGLYCLGRFLILPRLFRDENLVLARRLAIYSLVVATVIVLAGFMFDDLSMMAATLGVVSAALVISLQDVCSSVAGWFVIMLGEKFGVGDRLEIDGVKGDVIDIQLLRTTLLEVDCWLGQDQPTGRIVVVPNNFIFKSKVHNFCHGHEYIWGKLDITVTYSTPVAMAQALFERVLAEENGTQCAEAQQAAASMKKRYGITDADYRPKLYINIADSGVKFNLLYVSHYLQSSSTRHKICKRIISELEHLPEVQLAYNTVQMLHAQADSAAPSAIMGVDGGVGKAVARVKSQGEMRVP